MSFHDVRLPTSYQYGSQYGPGFSTVVQQTASGHEYRIARQSAPRHSFRLIKDLQSPTEAAALKTFILARRGALHSFRLKDWSDYKSSEDGSSSGTVTALDCVLGHGAGVLAQVYQLAKRYNEGAAGELVRTITLPVDGTVMVAIDGVTKTLGVDYTLTNPGGVITFAVAPTLGAVITAGFEFDVNARFELSVDEWQGIRSDSFAVWSLGQIPCIEVLDEVEYPELWYPGGYEDWGSPSKDISLSMAQGALHVLRPTAGINAFLPTPPTLFPGGPEIFTVHVPPVASGTVQIRDDAGNTVGAAFGAGNTKRLGGFVLSGTFTWILY